MSRSSSFFAELLVHVWHVGVGTMHTVTFAIDQYKTRFQIERFTTYKESANAMRHM